MRALVVFLILALASVAAADSKKVTQAKHHFAKGDDHFKKQEYDLAIAEFKRAFELAKIPLLLYNIAQAYRLKGDPRLALAYYEDYLRLDPASANRPQVEKRIEELEAIIAKEDATKAPTPAPTTPPTTPVAEPSPPTDPPVDDEPSPGRTFRIAGIATAGGGLALVSVSLIFAVKASSNYDDISKLSDDMGTWTPAQAEKLERADRYQLTAIVLGVTGGAALAGGAALYFLGWRAAGNADADIAVVPAPDGIVVVGRF